MVTASFGGWDSRLRDFFVDLAANNTKVYFDANRERYQRVVREPTEALVAALTPRYGPGRIFRINRDIRFSPDKRPYHTNIGVEFSGGGAHHYVSVSADELFTSVGMHRPGKDWLDRFRVAVAGPAGAELGATIAALDTLGFEIDGQELKQPPRGYPADHPHAELLRYKGITASRRWQPADWLDNPNVLELIVGTFDQARPLSDWLGTHCPAPA